MAASSDATAHFNRTHSRSQSHTGFPVDCLQSIACRCHLHRPGPLQPFQNLLSQPSGTSVPRSPLCLRAAASVSTSHPCGRHRHDRITERPPQGGTPGWQATWASPPCSRSQHHRDGPHDEVVHPSRLSSSCGAAPCGASSPRPRYHPQTTSRCWTALPSIGRTLGLRRSPACTRRTLWVTRI